MSTPGRNAYNDAALIAVINGTDTAISGMEGVNRQVMSISGQLPQVNRSTSGMKLGTALANWNAEFNRVVGDLRALNEKAKGLLNLNRSVDTETSTTANGAS